MVKYWFGNQVSWIRKPEGNTWKEVHISQTAAIEGSQYTVSQPNSLAAALRKASVIPVARLLWASHSKHFSMSACQSMWPTFRHLYEEPHMSFLSSCLELVDFIGPLCSISRRTEVLRARTCALGWERQRMVADRRHCMDWVDWWHQQMSV